MILRPASDEKHNLDEAVNAAMIIVTLNWGALPVEQYLLVSRTSFSRKLSNAVASKNGTQSPLSRLMSSGRNSFVPSFRRMSSDPN
jgi:hypothetical protein